MFRLPLLSALAIWFSAAALPAREFTVLTYNVENLFDADGLAAFEDYKETGGPNSYTRAHALEKIRTIGRVLGTFNGGQGPEVVLLNEIEIDFSPDSRAGDLKKFLGDYSGTTLEKMLGKGFDGRVKGLPSEALLLKHLEDSGLKGYHVAVGADAPDLASLDAGDGRRVRAQKNAVFSKFPITAVRSHPAADARDILEATLDVDGKPFTVFANHWKSGASDPESEATRRENAKVLRARLDEIFAADPSADVLVAGDFNSNHNQSAVLPALEPTAVNTILGSHGDEAATAAAQGPSLYNLWYELPPHERGSEHHRGRWGTLMQKMLPPGLYDRNGIQYVDNSFSRVVLPGLNAATPLRLPRRWTNAGAQGGGASDHFPVAARFRTVGDGDKETRLKPVNPGSDAGEPAQPLEIDYRSIKKGSVPAFSGADAADPGGRIGEVFLVKGRVVSEKPTVVVAAGGNFEVFSHDGALRQRMDSWKPGDMVEFLGQFGMHRGRLQFVVHDGSWIVGK